MQLGIEPSRRDFANLTAVAGELLLLLRMGKNWTSVNTRKECILNFFKS